ncbi:hypothetical protein GQ42DRAFT_162900 [Ramicandelaber brevisporus]|nr:hypothetical protein GQ42DRAFT_162900 [Ramicandelaber brevisporus]
MSGGPKPSRQQTASTGRGDSSASRVEGRSPTTQKADRNSTTKTAVCSRNGHLNKRFLGCFATFKNFLAPQIPDDISKSFSECKGNPGHFKPAPDEPADSTRNRAHARVKEHLDDVIALTTQFKIRKARWEQAGSGLGVVAAGVACVQLPVGIAGLIGVSVKASCDVPAKQLDKVIAKADEVKTQLDRCIK